MQGFRCVTPVSAFPAQNRKTSSNAFIRLNPTRRVLRVVQALVCPFHNGCWNCMGQKLYCEVRRGRVRCSTLTCHSKKRCRTARVLPNPLPWTSWSWSPNWRIPRRRSWQWYCRRPVWQLTDASQGAWIRSAMRWSKQHLNRRPDWGQSLWLMMNT